MSLCIPQVVGALDLLLALLHGSPVQESLAPFLLEPGNLEVLLSLLVRPRSLPLLSDRVCKVHPAHPARESHLLWPLLEVQGGAAGLGLAEAAFADLSWSHIPHGDFP